MLLDGAADKGEVNDLVETSKSGENDEKDVPARREVERGRIPDRTDELEPGGPLEGRLLDLVGSSSVDLLGPMMPLGRAGLAGVEDIVDGASECSVADSTDGCEPTLSAGDNVYAGPDTGDASCSAMPD